MKLLSGGWPVPPGITTPEALSCTMLFHIIFLNLRRTVNGRKDEFSPTHSCLLVPAFPISLSFPPPAQTGIPMLGYATAQYCLTFCGWHNYVTVNGKKYKFMFTANAGKQVSRICIEPCWHRIQECSGWTRSANEQDVDTGATFMFTLLNCETCACIPAD